MIYFLYGPILNFCNHFSWLIVTNGSEGNTEQTIVPEGPIEEAIIFKGTTEPTMVREGPVEQDIVPKQCIEDTVVLKGITEQTIVTEGPTLDIIEVPLFLCIPSLICYHISLNTFRGYY